MFGSDLNNEYAVAARLLDLDERGLAGLAKNAVEASFLDPAGKTRLAGEIDDYTAKWLTALRTAADPGPRAGWPTPGAAQHNGPMRTTERTVTVVAHRGDPYRVRENTLPSIASALERGADAVEIDVRTTRDGVPVLLHDDTLKRLWDVDRPLAELPYEEVREVTGGGVPTLRQALIAVGAHRVMIDLPGATEKSVREVVGTVRECGAGERVYYCAGPVAMLASAPRTRAPRSP